MASTQSDISNIVNQNLVGLTACTGGNQLLFDQVQEAVDCACGSEGPAGGSLCQAIAAGEIMSQAPFSCMIDLLTGQYSECDIAIPSDKLQAAYNAFTEVTNYQPINLSKVFNDLNTEQKKLIRFNAFYIFMPIMILILIIIWMLVGFGWIQWEPALYFTILSIILLYGFSIAYRIHTERFLNTQYQNTQHYAQQAQQNYQNSVAYWPQGIYAIACALTSTGTTGWTCNAYNPCTNTLQNYKTCRSGACMGKQESQPQQLTQEVKSYKTYKQNRFRNQ